MTTRNNTMKKTYQMIDYVHVSPRYSCGSPATVPLEQALREVAEIEVRLYEHTLCGRYGGEALSTAEVLGLTGICEVRWYCCPAQAWFVWDILTGEFSERRRDDGKLQSNQRLSVSTLSRSLRIRFKKECIETFGELKFPVPELGTV